MNKLSWKEFFQFKPLTNPLSIETTGIEKPLALEDKRRKALVWLNAKGIKDLKPLVGLKKYGTDVQSS